MSEETVKQWCKIFKDWRTKVHDDEWSDRPSFSKWKPHNVRTFMWISTNSTHFSLWDYHS
jgi:hypothetical protein